MQKIQKSQDLYKLKNWCDAKDETGVWRVGRIKKRDKNKLHITFDGWSDKYKRLYCIHSPLIAPFRMHTLGYTGQKSRALREWEYTENTFRVPGGLMQILSHSNFTGLVPFELTSFVRGDLYILVDCLLCHNYSNPSKEVNEVGEFLKNVISLVIKWMSVVPGEIKNCDFERHDTYLSHHSDAICRAIYEVTDMMCSIFGFNARTAVFYNNYKGILTSLKFIQHFFNEKGMDHFISLIRLRTIDLEQIWHVIINLPTIFSKSTAVANEKYIKEFTEALLNEFEVIPPESLIRITENFENVNIFMKNLENMTELMFSPHERENYIGTFRKLFQLRKNPELQEPQLEVHRISLLTSPRNKPPAGLFRTQNSVTIPPLKVQSARLDCSGSELAQVNELLERKYEDCVKMIEERLSMRKVTEDSLLAALQGHFSCDQQEFSVLNTIEFLLSEGRQDEALRVIRWKKKILKVAAVNGWEVAKFIAKETLYKLDVDLDDILSANIRKKSAEEEVE